MKEDPESIAQLTLTNYFKEKSLYPLQGLQGAIELHCLVYENQLDLAQMVSKLRPLNKLQKVCDKYVLNHQMNPHMVPYCTHNVSIEMLTY